MTTTPSSTPSPPLARRIRTAPGARRQRNNPDGQELGDGGAAADALSNLDPEVAEDPDNLVVYGGTGKAARNWASFDAICRELTTLEQDETLLVQSGKPVGVLRTHEWAPRSVSGGGRDRRRRSRRAAGCRS